MSVAGRPIRPRIRASRRTLRPTPTTAALGPETLPETSINIPPSLRSPQYRSFGHLTLTPRVPSCSSERAAPTATARLRPASAPAPPEKRHRSENARLPPTAPTQEFPRPPRPPLCCSQASAPPCGAPASPRPTAPALVDR